MTVMFGIFSLFKRKRKDISQKEARQGILYSFQVKLSSYLFEKQKRFTFRQRKLFFLLFCILIIGIQFFYLYKMIKPDNQDHFFLPHQTITTPTDITLPDSLDIKVIQTYKHFKKLENTTPK